MGANDVLYVPLFRRHLIRLIGLAPCHSVDSLLWHLLPLMHISQVVFRPCVFLFSSYPISSITFDARSRKSSAMLI